MKFILSIVILSALTFAGSFKIRDERGLKDACKQVSPGDTIVLANGIWKDAKLLFLANGTEEKPVLLTAETPGEVILTGSSSLRIAGDYLIVSGLKFKDGSLASGSVIEFRNGTETESNYSRLTNTSIENYNPRSDEIEYKWVSLYGTRNRVDHCYFINKNHQGCLLVVWLSDKPNYNQIDSNYFAFRPLLGRNGAEIIRIGTSEWSMYPSHTLVEANYFEECNGEREAISVKSFHNTLRRNVFSRCKGTLTLRHGNGSVVDGNYFLGEGIDSTGGVRIIGENHIVVNNYFENLGGDDVYSAVSFMNGVPDSPLNRYFRVKNAVVAFNTLINNRRSISIGTGKDDELSLSPENSRIINNIIISSSAPLFNMIDKPVNFTISNNILYGADPGFNAEGNFIMNPGMRKDESGRMNPSGLNKDFNPVYKTEVKIDKDIDGELREGKDNPGCDIASDAPVKMKRIEKSDVGPDWMRSVR